MYKPCSPLTSCVNTKPGFICSACPVGYTGGEIRGAGVESALKREQVWNLFISFIVMCAGIVHN